MPFPTTIEGLRQAGYSFIEHAKCRGCPATIEWWKTPKGKRMPMDVDEKGNCVSHFSTCPNAQDFRKEA